MYSIFRQSQLFDVPVVQPLAVPKFGDERGVRHHEDVLLVHNTVLHASLHDIAPHNTARVNAKASVHGDSTDFYSHRNLVQSSDARIRHFGTQFSVCDHLGILGILNPPLLRWKQPTMWLSWATTIKKMVYGSKIKTHGTRNQKKWVIFEPSSVFRFQSSVLICFGVSGLEFHQPQPYLDWPSLRPCWGPSMHMYRHCLVPRWQESKRCNVLPTDTGSLGRNLMSALDAAKPWLSGEVTPPKESYLSYLSIFKLHFVCQKSPFFS